MTRRRPMVILGVLMCAAATAISLTGSGTRIALPSFAEVRDSFRPSDMTLLDRRGEILHERRVDFHGRRLGWMSLAYISPALQTAVVVSDRRFYRHGGVDYRVLLGAIACGLVGKPVRGASTISMQLVTLIDPMVRLRGTPRTIHAKVGPDVARLETEAQLVESPDPRSLSQPRELSGRASRHYGRNTCFVWQSAAWDYRHRSLDSRSVAAGSRCSSHDRSLAGGGFTADSRRSCNPCAHHGVGRAGAHHTY
jgi:Transglycosylase